MWPWLSKGGAGSRPPQTVVDRGTGFTMELKHKEESRAAGRRRAEFSALVAYEASQASAGAGGVPFRRRVV
jgi:hypothetical protein